MAKRSAASPPGTRKRAPSRKPNGDARSPVATVAPKPSEEDIRLRAYHRYLERGAGDGSDFDDWLEAEKDLKSSR
jgi:hypothetical protein